MSLSYGTDPNLQTLTIAVLASVATTASNVFMIDTITNYFTDKATLSEPGRSADKWILMIATLSMHVLGLIALVVNWNDRNATGNLRNNKDLLTWGFLLMTFVLNVLGLLYKWYWTMATDAFSLLRAKLKLPQAPPVEFDRTKPLTRTKGPLRYERGVGLAVYEWILTLGFVVFALFLILWPIVLTWVQYAEQAQYQASTTRVLFLVAGVVFMVAFLIDFAIHFTRKSSTKVVTGIATKLGVKMDLGTMDLYKIASKESIMTLPITGSTLLDTSHPFTCIISKASNVATENSSKIAGLGRASFHVRGITDDLSGDTDFFVLSPKGAVVLDSLMGVDDHFEAFEHPAGGTSLFFNRAVHKRKAESYTIQYEDQLSHYMDSPPLLGTYPSPQNGVAPMTRRIMGYASGLGIHFNGGNWRNSLMTAWLLVAYILVLGNETSGFSMWMKTAVPALLFSWAGRRHQFFELLSHQIFYAWTLEMTQHWIVASGFSSTGTYRTILFNNTAIYQQNTSVVNLDEVFGYYSVTDLLFTLTILYFVSVVIHAWTMPKVSIDEYSGKTPHTMSSEVSFMPSREELSTKAVKEATKEVNALTYQ